MKLKSLPSSQLSFFKKMELHLKIIGVLLMLLAIIHASFPKYFNWKQELSSLSVMNRQMMYVHSFYIAFIVFLMGLLCITSSNEILYTPFGKKIALAFAIFWASRLLIQLFGYSSKIWKGKNFETAIHILFLLFWSYLSVVFALTYTT